MVELPILTSHTALKRLLNPCQLLLPLLLLNHQCQIYHNLTMKTPKTEIIVTTKIIVTMPKPIILLQYKMGERGNQDVVEQRSIDELIANELFIK
jgi:hypothetical protein